MQSEARQLLHRRRCLKMTRCRQSVLGFKDCSLLDELGAPISMLRRIYNQEDIRFRLGRSQKHPSDQTSHVVQGGYHMISQFARQ
jgi:hypothetical protein